MHYLIQLHKKNQWMYNIVLFTARINENKMKQTAVEWLEKELNLIEENKYTSYIELKIKQAKAMEKEQAQKMYEYAAWAMFYNGHGETFEEYWNKNFKSE